MGKYYLDSRTYFYIKRSLLQQVSPDEIIKNAPDENLLVLFKNSFKEEREISVIEFRYVLSTKTDYNLPRFAKMSAETRVNLLHVIKENDWQEVYFFLEKNGIEIDRVLSLCTLVPQDVCKKNFIAGNVSCAMLIDILDNQIAYL